MTIIVQDTFTAPNETQLLDHVGEIGATWSTNSDFLGLFPNTIGSNQLMILSDQVKITADGSISIQPSGANASISDFAVELNGLHSAGLFSPVVSYCFSASTLTNSMYEIKLVLNASTIDCTLNKIVSSSVVQSSSQTIGVAPGSPWRLSITQTGNVINAQINGVNAIGFVDPSKLDPGFQFIWLNQESGTSLYLDDITVASTNGPTPTPIPPGSGKFFFSPVGNGLQVLNSNGEPIVGAKLFTYVAGTNTPVLTAANNEGTSLNTIPILTNSSGLIQDPIWLLEGYLYKFVLTDDQDNVMWSQDFVPGINDITTSTNVNTEVWVLLDSTPVRLSDTEFSVIGNFADVFHAGRRILLVQSSSNYYGTVLSCSVSSPTPGEYFTTIEVELDYGIVLSSIETCYYSFLDSQNSAVPVDLFLVDKVNTLETQVQALTDTVNALIAKVDRNTPVGTIAAYPSGAIPPGWILANGAAISRTTYSDLYAKIGTWFGAGDGSSTFNVPDLRGVVVRGYDDGRGLDPGRVFGWFQDDAFQGHEHEFFDLKHGGGGGYNGAGAVDWTRSTQAIVQKSGFSAPKVADETRMKNVALNYLIFTGVV